MWVHNEKTKDNCMHILTDEYYLQNKMSYTESIKVISWKRNIWERLLTNDESMQNKDGKVEKGDNDLLSQ